MGSQRRLSLRWPVLLLATVVMLISPAAPARAALTDAEKQAFVATAVAAAREDQAVHDVPISVTVAQAILESGWGRSKLTTQANNYFGIKCGRTVSPYQNGCVTMNTSEYIDGEWVTVPAQFRNYDSPANSFLDHGRLLSTAARYAPAMQVTNDPDEFIRRVHQGGYATDPGYADKVIAVMATYDLYSYDVNPSTGPAAGATGAEPSVSELLATWVPAAQEAQQAYSVPSRITLGMAIFHSGWGASASSAQANNPFGLYCLGPSKRQNSCPTISGDRYRGYDQAQAAFLDAAQLLAQGRRYRSSLKLAGNTTAYLDALAGKQWTAQPGYAAAVGRVIDAYGLQRHDLRFKVTLKSGASGTKVRAALHLLRAAGPRLTVGSRFTARTAAHVKAYQRSQRLPVTGTINPRTLTVLAATTAKGAPADRVKAAQVLLTGRGYRLVADGDFGTRTLAAVKKFQAAKGLPVTGTVDLDTWGKLFA